MQIVERSHFPVAAASHPGMSGKQNEDRYGVTAMRLDDGTPALLAVLADGIGGHQAGEVAAEIAVEQISQAVVQSEGRDPVATLQQAIRQASREIRNQARSEQRRGMGATCACAWIIGQRLYIASVGDSRIYLVRNGTIRQLTKDHTWVQEAIDQGALSPAQARSHPLAHVIRRHLGSENTVVPDVRLHLSPQDSETQALANQGVLLQAGDHVILCSDGLTDLVEDEEILSALQERGMRDAVPHLIEMANRRGGHDNITVLAVEVPQEKPKVPWLWLAGGVLLVSLLCLLVGGVGVWWLLLGGK